MIFARGERKRESERDREGVSRTLHLSGQERRKFLSVMRLSERDDFVEYKKFAWFMACIVFLSLSLSLSLSLWVSLYVSIVFEVLQRQRALNGELSIGKAVLKGSTLS